ncbi:uncharacterized protein LOC112546891 [Pelodiscus sinensis]|uniref:uncharacterized protein LOC112546891 n=1 Tax=Pelodiscus sinensis TaxID=13735 RepID=UPI003F6CF161
MKSGGHCWSILLFLGFSHALLVEITQDSVNGTVGHSVLLPISYRLQPGPFPSPLGIQWYFSNTPNPLISYTATNCSVDAEGIPTNCSWNHFTHAAYRGRAELFPENASLLLQNLQLNDSGVYGVTFSGSRQTKNITLTVSELHVNHGNPDSNGNTGDGGKPKKNPYLLPGLLVTAGLSLLLVLLLLVFCFRWHMGEVQQRKRKIIKKQEVPNNEDSPMESSIPNTVSTIYARIGDVGQRQLAFDSQTEYAYVCFS